MKRCRSAISSIRSVLSLSLRPANMYAGTSWDELKHVRQAVGFLLELFLSSGTVSLSIYSLVAGIFGMNIPYTWNDHYDYMFKWVVICAGAFCAIIFVPIISYARYKGLVGS